MTRLALLTVLLAGLAGCSPCESLEEKLCADLGAEDCKLWREGNGPDLLYSGRRSFKFCLNARFTMYDPLLTGARAQADAMRPKPK